MKALQHIFSIEAIEALGWTIVHSLWQAAIVAIVLSLFLLVIRKNSAQLKYVISFFALITILGWSAVTFVNAYQYAQEKSAIRENITINPNYIKTYIEESITQSVVEEETPSKAINLSVVKLRSFFQRNFNIICSLWIVGIIFLLFQTIGGFIYARRLRTYQLMDIGEEWVAKIDKYTNKLKIKRKVQAFFSPLAKTPMTLGTIKPVILFPLAAFTGLSTKDIEAILAHELAHVVRHDYLFNIIQKMVEILFFYHPAVWIISAQIRNERENSCDNIAIELTGDKVAYVKALAQVQINEAEQGQLAMAFASPKNNVLNRIKRLQKQVAMKTNFIEGLIAAVVVVVGLTLVSFTMGNKINPQVMPVDNNELQEEPIDWTVEKRDSVKQVMEKKLQEKDDLEKVSEEIETMVEMALSENDEEIAAEMMEEINEALEDLDIDEIVQDALWEAKKALEEVDMDAIMDEAREDIDYDEIQRDMDEARRDIREARKEMREEIRRDMNNDDVPEEIIELSIEAAEMGLEAAEAVIENLPLEEIIEAALGGVEAAFEAIEDIDFEEILDEVEDAMDEVENVMDEIEDDLEEYEDEQDYEREKSKRKQKYDQQMREELQEEREALKQQLDIERKEMYRKLEKDKQNIERQKEELKRREKELEERKEELRKLGESGQAMSNERKVVTGMTEEEAKQLEKKMKDQEKQMDKKTRKMERETKKAKRKAKRAERKEE